MIKKVELPIKNKVLKKADVLNLAKSFYKVYLRAKGNKSVSFEFTAADGSSYKVQDKDPKELEQILTRKKLIAIAFDCYVFSSKSSLTLRISEQYPWQNYLEVESGNTVWFNNARASVEDVLGDVRDQNNLLLKYRRVIPHILAAYFGYLVFTIVWSLFNILGIGPIHTTNDWLLKLSAFAVNYPSIFYTATFYLSGIGVALVVMDYIYGLWPSIEFDFGPDHLKRAKNRRKILWTTLTIFVIPILLQIGDKLFF